MKLALYWMKTITPQISVHLFHLVNPERIKNFSSYFEAVDEFLNNLIVNSDVSKNLDLEKRIELLEHDMKEQEKAKNLVISKSAN